MKGRRALVTGASRGIGLAISEALAGAGADVAMTSRRPEGIAAAAALVAKGAPDRRVVGLPRHAGDVDGLDAFVADLAVQLGGPIDTLVINAGTNPSFGPLFGTSWEAWRKTMQVNLEGPFALVRAVCLAAFETGTPVSIVVVSSILGDAAAPMQGVYGMTKAALISMTRTLAVELAPAGVRINALAPGLIDTKLAAAIVSDDGLRTGVLARTPLGRVGQPSDVAGAAVFLCSDAAAYITGQVLHVDGGWSVT